MTFENLFSIGASMRVALGIIFALFVICFVAIAIEEMFLGGRRRRAALKKFREREKERTAYSATADPAPQNSHTPHPPR